MWPSTSRGRTPCGTSVDVHKEPVEKVKPIKAIKRHVENIAALDVNFRQVQVKGDTRRNIDQGRTLLNTGE